MRALLLVLGLAGAVAPSAGAAEFAYDLAAGWSLISLPLDVPDRAVATLFPAATSLFAYTPGTGYVQADSLAPGKGYWLNLPAPVTHTLSGSAPEQAGPVLASGWNLVGPLATPLTAASLGADVASVFGFDGGYAATTELLPGTGYWVNRPAAAATVPCDHDADAGVHAVSVDQLHQLLDGLAPLVLVDVREPHETATGIIAPALLYPWSSGELAARHAELPATKPLYLICRSGGRSAQAAAFMVAAGHYCVHTVTGGMDAWTAAGYGTVAP